MEGVLVRTSVPAILGGQAEDVKQVLKLKTLLYVIISAHLYMQNMHALCSNLE